MDVREFADRWGKSWKFAMDVLSEEGVEVTGGVDGDGGGSHQQQQVPLISVHSTPPLQKRFLTSSDFNVPSDTLAEDVMQVDEALGCNALHVAVSCGAPLSVLNTLLDIAPASASAVDNEGLLPLHLAMAYNRGTAIISALLGAFPGGASTNGRDGQLPLLRSNMCKHF